MSYYWVFLCGRRTPMLNSTTDFEIYYIFLKQLSTKENLKEKIKNCFDTKIRKFAFFEFNLFLKLCSRNFVNNCFKKIINFIFENKLIYLCEHYVSLWKKKMPEDAFILRSETRRFKGQPLIFKFILIWAVKPKFLQLYSCSILQNFRDLNPFGIFYLVS